MFPIDPVLALIIFFGTWASADDIINGKIRNVCITSIIIAGLFVNLFITKGIFEMPYLTAANIFFSVLAAVLMWWSRLWSAGDAKLFIGFSILIPVYIYKNTRFFPGIEMLFNTFVPIFVFLIAYMLLKTSIAEKRNAMKGFLSKKFILNFAIRFVALFLFGNVIIHFTGIGLDMFSNSIVMFIVLYMINKAFPDDNRIFIFMSVLSAVILINTGFLDLNNIMNIAKYSVIFFIFLFFFNELGKMKFAKEIPLSELKEGMILAELIIEKNGRFEKVDINYFGITSNLLQKNRMQQVVRYGSSYLSGENVNSIIKLSKLGRIKFKTIKVSQTVPFAPIIFVGCLLTYFHIF